MKKIMTVAAIAAASFAVVINGNAGKAHAGVIKNAVSCADDYVNDTTPKKHKRKKDTTTKDTTALVYNLATPTTGK